MDMQELLENELDTIAYDPSSGITVNDYPKILFVNGLWGKFVPGSPAGGDRLYWFDGAAFFNAAASYFNLPGTEGSGQWQSRFADASTNVFKSGAARKTEGSDFANTKYAYLIGNSSLPSLDFYIVSHSQGGAYAAGIAEYLKGKGHNIKEILFLSTYEGGGFTIDPTIPSYQAIYSCWEENYLTGKHYIAVDWVVGDYRIAGVTRYGIIITDVGLTYLHGSTNSSGIFNQMADLKNVVLTQNLNGAGEIYYSQSGTSHGTLFYEVDGTLIAPNHKDWNPSTHTIDD